MKFFIADSARSTVSSLLGRRHVATAPPPPEYPRTATALARIQAKWDSTLIKNAALHDAALNNLDQFLGHAQHLDIDLAQTLDAVSYTHL